VRAAEALGKTLVAGALFASMTYGGAAHAASPCDDPRPGTGTPARVPLFGPADFGTSQEACARTRVALESRGALLVAERDFYGTLLAGAQVRATVGLSRGTWVSVVMPGIEYRFVANATVEAERASLGAGALGLHVPVAETASFRLVTYGRVLLPTETIYTNATRHGLEHGLTGLVRANGWLEIMGTLAFPTTFVSTSGRVTLGVSPVLAVDAIARPARAFGVAAGFGLRPLDSFDPRVQLRLYPFGNAFVALGGTFPMFGRDRTTAGVGLSLGWDGL
jgi:hypothetical protein